MTELKPAILTCLEQLRCFCDNFHFICAQFNPKPCDICLSRLDTSEDMQLLLSCHLIMKGVRPSFALLFKNIYIQSSENIYFLQYCSVGLDDEILSNEVKSLGVKFLYLISNTHQVFLVLGKHTSLTAALLIERFLLIIQQGGISFYNLYNFNSAVWNRYQLVIISQNI